MIHRHTSEERLLDVLIDGRHGFSAVLKEIREHVNFEWELWEYIDCDEDAF